MALPNVPEFSTLLASLALRTAKEKECLEAIELVSRTFVTDGSAVFAEDPIHPSYESSGSLTLEGLVLKIQAELRRLKHKNDLSIVHAILGIYCLDPARKRSPADHLNRLLGRTVEVKLKR